MGGLQEFSFAIYGKARGTKGGGKSAFWRGEISIPAEYGEQGWLTYRGAEFVEMSQAVAELKKLLEQEFFGMEVREDIRFDIQHIERTKGFASRSVSFSLLVQERYWKKPDNWTPSSYKTGIKAVPTWRQYTAKRGSIDLSTGVITWDKELKQTKLGEVEK
jgi:hypothetical protein